jgi:hypothetical protein
MHTTHWIHFSLYTVAFGRKPQKGHPNLVCNKQADSPTLHTTMSAKFLLLTAFKFVSKFGFKSASLNGQTYPQILKTFKYLELKEGS